MTDAVDLAQRIHLVVATAESEASRLYRNAVRRKEPPHAAYVPIVDALDKVKAICTETIANGAKP
jgi:hypothetical protein